MARENCNNPMHPVTLRWTNCFQKQPKQQKAHIHMENQQLSPQ